ncbi:glycosyltransferase [Parabacteroides provencensis]|uniref:glycosyltransferase n=1 Tax=Parabacteroides provencensis TaxID=1944636 RepID=UPI000C14CF36|nr:glycosyltransferase [Parabacteroides provencensis]
MNILLLYYTPFSEDDSFYWFYKQLVLWFNKKGYPSELHFCYLDKKEKEVINGLQLPDAYSFNSQRNVSAIVNYMKLNKIKIVFNFYLPVWKIGAFFISIKNAYPDVKLIELIHNCPNHSLQLKEYCLMNPDSGYRPSSLKERIVKVFPKLYLILLKKKLHQENKQAYNLHDAIVVLSSSYISEYLTMIGKEKSDKVFAIPNSLAPSSFLKSNVSIENKKKEILFVGGIRIEKSVMTLLKIWKEIQYKIPEWKLVIVGDGIQMPLCKKLYEDYNLERVEFKGYVDSRPLIDRASILCLTSIIEGLPTVFLEAMSMGVIPIGFNTFSAIYDMIDNWKNGVIIPAFDMELYAKSLIRLAKDDELRFKIAKDAILKVKQYDIENVGEKWFVLFRDLKFL